MRPVVRPQDPSPFSRGHNRHIPSPLDSSFIVMPAHPGEDPASEARRIYTHISGTLCASGSEIVQERIFGSLTVEAPVRAARREALELRGICTDGPLTWLQGRPTWGDGLAGVIVHAVTGSEARTVFDEGAACGRTWQSGGVRFIVLQGIQGIRNGLSSSIAPSRQVERAIERATRLLRENGADYRDTLRTWFYLSRILDWYGDFNEARNTAYRKLGLLPCPGEKCSLPASTGIRADVVSGAVCSLDLLAVTRCESDRCTSPQPDSVCECIRNPRQPEAMTYGSAFSRCTIVQAGVPRLIEISGTAAIDENGHSMHPGDIRAQTRCTLDRISALLQQANTSLADVRAATLFLKHGDDENAVRTVLAELGLSQLPAIWVEADVCRDDLLFEMDAEAIGWS